jgi:Heparinase II/III-like protein
MWITFICPSCSAKNYILDGTQGQKMACSACGNILVATGVAHDTGNVPAPAVGAPSVGQRTNPSPRSALLWTLAILCIFLLMSLSSLITWVWIDEIRLKEATAAQAPSESRKPDIEPVVVASLSTSRSDAPPPEAKTLPPVEHNVSVPPAPVKTTSAPPKREPALPAATEEIKKEVKQQTPPPLLEGKGLAIPKAHPRIWWSRERLARARSWLARHRLQPRSDNAWDNGLCYVVTRQPQYARVVIKLMLAFEIPEERLEQVSVDYYRWNDWFPVLFDWTYDAMTEEQRRKLIQRYNHYVEVTSKKPWGGPTMPTNNYYWGYFRNELNWAIATYYESPMARSFLEHALTTRWQKSFTPFAASQARGGVPSEGTQYGRYMLQYPVVPFTTMRLLGRDLFRETDFYRDAIFYMIYGTTPAPTFRKGGQEKPYYQLFPFADDENDGGYPSARSSYYGDFMAAMADEWGEQPVGQYARHWLAGVQPEFSNYVAAVDDPGKQREFGDLPLDYYATSAGYFYLRTRWSPDCTALLLQLGHAPGNSHPHLDQGTFQIWRHARWLSKESTGYSMPFAGSWPTATNAHNGIVFNNRGQANSAPDGPAKILRLESRADYAYAAVDLTPVYRAHKANYPDRDDNPYVGHVVREFLFIRPMETLLVLDRLESTSEKDPANEVVKTFVLHFPEKPQVQGTDSVLGQNGDQALQITTLVPAKPEYEVVDEGDFTGKHYDASFYQYRLEVKDKGQAQSYFLHVLQARDSTGVAIQAQIKDEADGWRVQLDHPTLGHAAVAFKKGMTSTGGAFAYAAKEPPTSLKPLRADVQAIKVTETGPVWGP